MQFQIENIFIGNLKLENPPSFCNANSMKKIGIIIECNKRYLVLERNPIRYTGWGLVTGTMEHNEQPIDTVIRELHEELGIQINDNQHDVHFCFETTYFSPRKSCQIIVYWHYIAFPQQPLMSIQYEEWLGYTWLSFDEACKKLTWESEQNVLKKVIGQPA